ncbi:LysR substrate-binding domain-containing protein [Parasedimentitalea huanghaiensis]|uniref:LysR family transcriptional regulator n=1 Tax=Parasedimentitalea huanghaiensis TaxID=2682100 RepID=A0A6L6WFN6_9RHOB|nr:LysR substrate-binding domain-containing protein [Zongyanglinia huanghaiensis]MVO16078.1 LysR family transcriptional regulator [Zongyanglinia huanghaiensis]
MPDQRPLPPLTAVRAFEAAARFGSFTRAAEELGMTQAAVSYQIKQLEDRAGVPLFRRQPRGVQLTPDGAQLAARAGEALEILREAFAELRQTTEDTLVISVIAAFAASVLGPRLWQFQAENPDIATRIDINQKPVNLEAGEASVAIRIGDGNWEGMRADHLMRPEITPMISPAYIERHGPLTCLEDLLTAPRVVAGHPAWDRWFEAAGLTPPCTKNLRDKTMGSQIFEVQAAKAGQGVTLLTPTYYRRELANGELIQPFDIVVESGRPVWLVYAERRRKSPAIRAFRKWLLAEMQTLVVAG